MPKPLILEYNFIPWMNRSYTVNEPEKKCMPDLTENYRGLEFIGVKTTKRMLKTTRRNDYGNEQEVH